MDSVRKKRLVRRNVSFPSQGKESLLRSENSSTKIQSSKSKIHNTFEVKNSKHTKKRSRHSAQKIFIFAATSLLVILLSFGGYTLWRAARAQEQVTGRSSGLTIINTAASLIASTKNAKEYPPLLGEEDGRVNILLLGKTGKNYPGQNLTDTIIIASIDTKNGRAGLLSLPRDLMVSVGDKGYEAKINSLYHLGRNDTNPMELARTSVEKITGLPLHYSLIVDYDGFVRIVDAVGGVNVTVERDIYDARYPGPNYSYELFSLDKGFHHLDGTTTLKYVRERHSDPMGDFGRAHRQQQVIQAVKDRVWSAGVLLNPFAIGALLDAVGDAVRTDITPEEIEPFIALIRRTDTHNIQTVVVDAWRKESILRVSHIFTNDSTRMFALVPRAGNWSEVTEAAKNLFDTEFLARRAAAITAENPRVAIIDTTENPKVAVKVRDLLENLGMNTAIVSSEIGAKKETTVLERERLEKPYSLDEIIQKVPAARSEDTDEFSDTVEKYDFVVVLGTDALSVYDWEEASVEEYQSRE